MNPTGKYMSAWQHFLDSLATKGGAILILTVLIFAGIVCRWLNWITSDQLAHEAFTSLLTALGISRLNNNADKNIGAPAPKDGD
jgi:hypothetical protein